MKKVIIAFTLLIFTSCEYQVHNTHVIRVIDSVVYHPIGSDHSLQTTPYWKVHLPEDSIWVTLYRKVEVGDSIEFVYRHVTKN